MKRSIVCFIIAFISMNSVFAQKNTSKTIEKELDSVFKKMWDNVTLTNANDYFKTDVSTDFYTINADGIVQNKQQLLDDKKRLEMLEMLDFKFFDQVIKVYDHVGIINGRIQAFSEGAYVGEIFYTAIFVKENGVWKYKNWQGTWTKDSPPPPSFVSED
ncbi:MAG: hypothetical protein Q8O62_02335 [Aequorivita sp.]|nr:hypothetical protein [Aequorivita sp.]